MLLLLLHHNGMNAYIEFCNPEFYLPFFWSSQRFVPLILNPPVNLILTPSTNSVYIQIIQNLCEPCLIMHGVFKSKIILMFLRSGTASISSLSTHLLLPITNKSLFITIIPLYILTQSWAKNKKQPVNYVFHSMLQVFTTGPWGPANCSIPLRCEVPVISSMEKY